MSLTKTILLGIIMSFSINAFCIEAIVHNSSNIFFIDSGTLYKYNLDGNIQIQNRLIYSDTSFQGSFLRNYKKRETLNKQIALRRLKIAQYENIILYNDNILIAVRFLSLDSSRDNFEIMLVEFDQTFHFKRIYFLHECSSPKFGTVDLYCRFKIHLKNKNEILLSLIVPPPEKLNNDSEFNFATFKLDSKRNELIFSKLIATKKDPLKMQIHVFNYYPFDKFYFPIQIPINYSSQPIYFSFPYLVVHNYKKNERLDPFDHTSYNKTHKQLKFNSFDKNWPHGILFNSVSTPQLVHEYNFEKDTLSFIITNYSDINQSPQLITFFDGKQTIKPLQSSYYNLNTWYHFINSKIIEISYNKNNYVIKYIKY